MELLVVIHHPRGAIRPVKELVTEIAGQYDRAMGQASRRHYHELAHTLIILLNWPCVGLGWPHWSIDPPKDGVLATVGMPLIHTPVDGVAEMLRPAHLKRLIRAEGAGASPDLAWCGGAFAAAHVGGDGQVRLVTNYLGEVPLYRAEGDDGMIVWSNKAAAAVMLAGIESRLDQQAAREFVLLAHPLENRSLYEGVPIESAGMCVLIDAAGVKRQPYVKLPEALFEYRLPKQEIVQRTVAAMEPVVTQLRESSADIRLHLSGGMDSRAVAAICTHYGYRPRSLTHSAPNDEVPSARRLAKRMGARYDAVEGETDDADAFFAQVNTCLWQSDGLASLKYLAGRYDLAMVRDEKYLPLEGLGGETGRGYYFGGEQAMAYLARGVFDPFYEKTVGKRAALWPSPGAAESVRSDLVALVEQYQQAGLDAFAATTCFYIDQRLRRWGVSRRNTGWQWMIDVLTLPCWTYYAAAADPNDQVNDQLMIALIDHAAPSFHDVPTARQLAAAGRRRRVASNRLVRSAMAMYDRLRGPGPPPVQTSTLERVRLEMIGHIRAAAPHMPQFLTAEDADGWLAERPWRYDQTELFWHTATLAMWCHQFLGKPAAIGPAIAERTSAS